MKKLGELLAVLRDMQEFSAPEDKLSSVLNTGEEGELALEELEFVQAAGNTDLSYRMFCKRLEDPEL